MNERICPICCSYLYEEENLKGWVKCHSCSFMRKLKTSMITTQEILMGRAILEDLPQEAQQNAKRLVDALNAFRKEFGKPMYVSSGYRSPEDNKKAGGSSKSAHLTLEACDFKDNGELFEFIKKDPLVLERCGLYLEDPSFTPTWIHLQIRPTKNRIFLPYSDGRKPSAEHRKI